MGFGGREDNPIVEFSKFAAVVPEAISRQTPHEPQPIVI